MVFQSGDSVTVVDEIKARIDIVDLVGESVQLRQSGRTFKALCPFHTEKTPSFVVDPGRQTWRCFGACSEGGDAFAWVMKQDSVGFREALGALAERTGVQLAPLDAHAEEREKRLDRLRSANEAAAAFYHQRLLNDADAAGARDYLEERGLTTEVIEAFRLGHAPQERDALLGYLSARGFSQDELVEAGLAIETERGARDRFSGRLMYPIHDGRGRCVGFGGRTLQGDAAKYINTSQTPLFDKSSLLYGLDRARENVRRQDAVIVVEGYMDVIAAHQHDQRNVVASMGTALTERQVALIKPLTHNILLALDADPAGMAATLRGIETTRDALGTEKVPIPSARGLVRMQDQLAADIRIIDLPEGRDPDDLIRLDPERWATLVREAPGYLDFRFDRAKATHDLSDARQRAALLDELVPLVSAIAQPVVREEYAVRLAALSRIDVKIVRSRAGRAQPAQGRRTAPRATAAEVPSHLARRPMDRPTAFLLKLVVARPEVLRELSEETVTLLEDTGARELLSSRLAASDTEAWRDALSPELRDMADALQAEASNLQPYSSQEACHAARDTVAKIRERRQRERLRMYRHEIAEQQRTLGASTLEQAAYDLDQGIQDPTDVSEESPAMTVLRSRAQGQELHDHRSSDASDEESQS